MRAFAVLSIVLAVSAAYAGAAQATTKARRPHVVAQSQGSTVVQPTRTIIHNPDGTTTIIVTPRRSYLDPGTEVSVGEGSYRDYMLPPGRDPGRPNWWFGPDTTGTGGYPIATPYYLPGINTNTPF
jgi:hypothetical protein